MTSRSRDDDWDFAAMVVPLLFARILSELRSRCNNGSIFPGCDAGTTVLRLLAVGIVSPRKNASLASLRPYKECPQRHTYSQTVAVKLFLLITMQQCAYVHGEAKRARTSPSTEEICEDKPAEFIVRGQCLNVMSARYRR
jgi:hypothetical protein